jgi:hypothetical protein
MNLTLILLAVSVGINLFYLMLHMSYHSLRIHEENQEEFHMKPSLTSRSTTRTSNVSSSSSPSITRYTRASHLHSVGRQCEGVAMTLLLHAPKWFQRRYTMMIANVINNIPQTWCVIIYYTSSGASQVGIDLSFGIQKLIEIHGSHRIQLVDIPSVVINERRKRIHLMYHPWIWSSLPANDVLVFGGNSVICSNSPLNLTSFLAKDLDYLGAPWDAFNGQGGDGGISLRKRDSMLKVIEYSTTLSSSKKDQGKERKKEASWQTWGAEDRFYVKNMLAMVKTGEYIFKIAKRLDTLQWSAIGSYAPTPHSIPPLPGEAPWAASGTLPSVKTDKERELFLQYCPELKILYPSTHNPNCFGAQVHAEECAASICALQPNKRSC